MILVVVLLVTVVACTDATSLTTSGSSTSTTATIPTSTTFSPPAPTSTTAVVTTTTAVKGPIEVGGLGVPCVHVSFEHDSPSLCAGDEIAATDSAYYWALGRRGLIGLLLETQKDATCGGSDETHYNCWKRYGSRQAQFGGVLVDLYRGNVELEDERIEVLFADFYMGDHRQSGTPIIARFVMDASDAEVMPATMVSGRTVVGSGGSSVFSVGQRSWTDFADGYLALGTAYAFAAEVEVDHGIIFNYISREECEAKFFCRFTVVFESVTEPYMAQLKAVLLGEEEQMPTEGFGILGYFLIANTFDPGLYVVVGDACDDCDQLLRQLSASAPTMPIAIVQETDFLAELLNPDDQQLPFAVIVHSTGNAGWRRSGAEALAQIDDLIAEMCQRNPGDWCSDK